MCDFARVRKRAARAMRAYGQEIHTALMPNAEYFAPVYAELLFFADLLPHLKLPTIFSHFVAQFDTDDTLLDIDKE